MYSTNAGETVLLPSVGGCRGTPVGVLRWCFAMVLGYHAEAL
jgi:hypothetical protein